MPSRTSSPLQGHKAVPPIRGGLCKNRNASLKSAVALTPPSAVLTLELHSPCFHTSRPTVKRVEPFTWVPKHL